MNKVVGLFDEEYIFHLVVMGEIRLAKEKVALEDLRGDRLRIATAKFNEGIARIDGLRLHYKRIRRPKVLPLFKERTL